MGSCLDASPWLGAPGCPGCHQAQVFFQSGCQAPRTSHRAGPACLSPPKPVGSSEFAGSALRARTGLATAPYKGTLPLGAGDAVVRPGPGAHSTAFLYHRSTQGDQNLGNSGAHGTAHLPQMITLGATGQAPVLQPGLGPCRTYTGLPALFRACPVWGWGSTSRFFWADSSKGLKTQESGSVKTWYCITDLLCDL